MRCAFFIWIALPLLILCSKDATELASSYLKLIGASNTKTGSSTYIEEPDTS